VLLRRFRRNFRRLNAVTVPDRYPMMLIDEVFESLRGKKVFSTLDLTSGFWQVEVSPRDRHLTAFALPGVGQFQYVRMPFGLCNAPATFYRLVNQALGPIEELKDSNGNVLSIARAYMDDIIVASDNIDVHLAHLQAIFEIFRANRLTVNLDKCTWLQGRIPFLGHIVDGDGCTPTPPKFNASWSGQHPSPRKTFSVFLGSVTTTGVSTRATLT
jgi:hypothetical protein